MFGQTVTLTNNKGFLSNTFNLTFDLTDGYMPNVGLLGWEATKAAYIQAFGQTFSLDSTSSDTAVMNAARTALNTQYGTTNTELSNMTLPYNDADHYLLEIVPSGTKPQTQGNTQIQMSHDSKTVTIANTIP